MCDASPSFHALWSGECEMLLGASRDHRHDGGDSQLRRLFDRPLHVVELENRHYQRNGHPGLRLDLGDEIEPHFRLSTLAAVRDRSDHGVVHLAPRNHVRLHSRLRAQHSNHVLRLRSFERGSGFIPILGNPPASRHRLYSCTFPLMRKNTSGDAVASPEVLPFWLDDPLLLLRGFLRGLFRGCFLGCFLSCHLPILPFRWFASSSATIVAVEECIDSCVVSVKKKTTMRGKKWQKFFRDEIALSSSSITKYDANGETRPSTQQMHRANCEQKFPRAGFVETTRAD